MRDVENTMAELQLAIKAASAAEAGGDAATIRKAQVRFNPIFIRF